MFEELIFFIQKYIYLNTFMDLLMFTIFCGALSIQIYVLCWLLRKQRSPVQEMLSKVIILILILGQSLIIYGGFIEPRQIEVVTHTIYINGEENITGKLKVILVSDYHLGPNKKADFVEKSVDLINKQKPDLVLIPGDFIFGHQEEIDYFAPFAKVKTTYGVYATLGNHDYNLKRNKVLDYTPIDDRKSTYVAEKLELLGINVLRNESIDLKLNDGETLNIIGLEDLWGNQSDFDEALNEVSAEENTVLIEHNPDIILDPRVKDIDLIVSGHTHGGQIRLPFIGPLNGIPTELGKDYDYGYFDISTDDEAKAPGKTYGKQLYITKGIGEIGTRARLFAKPEVVVLDLYY